MSFSTLSLSRLLSKKSLLSSLFLCFVVGLSSFLTACNECRYDSECPSGTLCTEGACIKQNNPPPVRPPPGTECLEGERKSCYNGPQGTAGIGACKSGVQICTNGQFAACTGEVLPAATEECDGLDNNCDGQVDEGCQCKDGDEQSCYTGAAATRKQGECRDGTQICINGVWAECTQQQLPQVEECNGKDDDCNGKIDDEVKRRCQTACGLGDEICVNGQFEPCNARLPEAEICGDGIDNNCDGNIDEGCECTPNQSRDCYSGPSNTQGVSHCKAGRQTCNAAGKWETCNGQSLPRAEACNNQDDDCNGRVDDNISRPCQRGCNTGKEVCSLGQWLACDAAPAAPEICDGIDNDCDGKIDNLPNNEVCECQIGQRETCYDPPAATLGRGPCKAGERICQPTGKWSPCSGQITPVAEVCDGIDNDCDGQIDNQPSSTQRIERSCYTGPAGTELRGACRQGKETCNNGQWSACTGQVTPKQETCNNQDDDCDGKIDESLFQNCYTGPAGTANVGRCKEGTRTCTSGTWSSCLGELTPRSETCNNIDDDCNGQIDDGGACDVCQSGQTQSCYTGPASTRNTLPCREGTSTCTGGQWGTCQGQTLPQTELCNNLDDDCNGQIDDGITRPCSNTCGAGTERCQAGQWVNCNAPTPSTEICDGIDNNCNGQIDEGLNCATLATVGVNGQAYIWDPFTYQRLRGITSRSESYAIAFSPDKQKIAIGNTNQIEIRNPDTGALIRTLTLTGGVRSIAWSKDSSRIAAGTIYSTANPNTYIRVWNANTGTVIQSSLAQGGNTVRGLAFHPTQDVLLAAGGNDVTFWNPTTGVKLRTTSVIFLIYTLDISPNGNSFVIAGPRSNSLIYEAYLQTWNITNLNSPTLSASFPVPAIVYQARFSFDGAHIIAAYLEGAGVWRIQNQQRIANPPLSSHWVYTAHLTPDNRYLITGSRINSPNNGILRIWDISTTPPTQVFNNTDHITYIWSLDIRP